MFDWFEIYFFNKKYTIAKTQAKYLELCLVKILVHLFPWKISNDNHLRIGQAFLPLSLSLLDTSTTPQCFVLTFLCSHLPTIKSYENNSNHFSMKKKSWIKESLKLFFEYFLKSCRWTLPQKPHLIFLIDTFLDIIVIFLLKTR